MTGNTKIIMKRNSLFALLFALLVSARSSDGVYFSDFRDILFCAIYNANFNVFCIAATLVATCQQNSGQQ